MKLVKSLVATVALAVAGGVMASELDASNIGERQTGTVSASAAKGGGLAELERERAAIATQLIYAALSDAEAASKTVRGTERAMRAPSPEELLIRGLRQNGSPDGAAGAEIGLIQSAIVGDPSISLERAAAAAASLITQVHPPSEWERVTRGLGLGRQVLKEE